jgi:hypothetical protein
MFVKNKSPKYGSMFILGAFGWFGLLVGLGYLVGMGGWVGAYIYIYIYVCVYVYLGVVYERSVGNGCLFSNLLLVRKMCIGN